MTTNITTTLIKDETLNSNIASMADPMLEKYIKRSLALVSSYVNVEQFNDGTDNIVYPEDMITAITCIIEYIYIDQGMFGTGPGSMKSETIGKYQYTKKDKAKSSGNIDLPHNILAILDKYSSLIWSLDISIWWYDRDYEDYITE